MEHVTIVGIDVSKGRFQVQRATAKDQPDFRKKLSRGSLPGCLSEVPPCLVVMEACGGAHHRGRQVIALDYPCKPIPPAWAKPFLNRQKNDIDDAAHHPTMRFGAAKPEAAQGDAMLCSTAEPQKAIAINAVVARRVMVMTLNGRQCS